MTPRSRLYRLMPALTLTLTAAALTACDEPSGTPLGIESADAVAQHSAHASARPASASHGPEVAKWLAALKRATAPFHRIAAAESAGWDTPLTGCMDLPGTGAMGFHVANMGLIDGEADALAPELLVYEPQKNGRARLVAVEYIIPFGEWTAAEPPSLHGVDFHRNDGFGLWVLHAWVWKHNPAGMFADWNPNVTCEYAETD